MCPGVLKAVASLAGKGEIRIVGTSVFGERNDMFDRMVLWAKRLRGPAVFTFSVRAFGNLTPHARSNAFDAHY